MTIEENDELLVNEYYNLFQSSDVSDYAMWLKRACNTEYKSQELERCISKVLNLLEKIYES